MPIVLALSSERNPAPPAPLRSHDLGVVPVWQVVPLGAGKVSLCTTGPVYGPGMSATFTPDCLPQLRHLVALLEQERR